MKAQSTSPSLRARTRRLAGSVLVIVLWVSFGLVTLSLYFANTNSLALKSSDQRTASVEADEAIDGAAQYTSSILANLVTPAKLPEIGTYLRDGEAIGDSTFWFIGRDPRQTNPNQPFFSLTDEASKLNLNTATLAMLEALPRMTPELAAAIIDWRDTDSDPQTGGAEDETYLRLNPPYHCKNSNFESVEELRMVYGMTMEILYGEDTNRNGALDQNENDGNTTPPFDNHDGRLDPGLIEYVTVYSRESNTTTNGTQRVNVTGNNAVQQMASVLQEALGADRANQVLRQLGGNTGGGRGNPPGGGGTTTTFRSVLEVFIRSGMTTEEFALVAPNLTMGTGTSVQGLINVNTASEVVLGCIPGIGTNNAASVAAYRLSNPDKLTSVAWLAEVLDRASALEAGRYITAYSYQFTADIAATGHLGRGYRRAQYIFDTSPSTASASTSTTTSTTTPRVIAYKDLSNLGWALGRTVRERQQQQVARTLR